jgi:pyruvate dehydrogenase E1 component alpha subunit/2-oxoisovalerate dehydrogenase E1 component alpha subunit
MNASLTREQAHELYYYLRLTRSLEDLLARLFRQNKVFGGLYSSRGQEAVSVGAAYALGPGDWMAPMIRNIGALLVRGIKPREILMQLMAREGSPTHGKDGTCHLADISGRHIVAPMSMLGDLLGIMTGVAMAGRYLGHKIVAMTWIGDGGTSTGAFHEGMNLAAVQKAALVVVVENNQWAYSTPAARQVPLRDLAERARAYGIASHIVDGNDLPAMLQVTREAVRSARAGEGPVLIEAKTMRMAGHAQHDVAAYVPHEMTDYWKARDPLARYMAYLTENQLWDAGTQAAIDSRVERELADELVLAEASPFPPPEAAGQGVYCDGCHTIEARWQRPREELLPPKSSVKAEWMVEDFGDMVPGVESAAAREKAQG